MNKANDFYYDADFMCRKLIFGNDASVELVTVLMSDSQKPHQEAYTANLSDVHLSPLFQSLRFEYPFEMNVLDCDYSTRKALRFNGSIPYYADAFARIAAPRDLNGACRTR